MVAKYLGVVTLLTVCAGNVQAQEAPRFEAGVIARADRVRVEGDLVEPMAAAGAGVSARLTKSLWVEAEVTRAGGAMARQYSGQFVSFAPPGSSLEEIERLSPTARRDLRYTPGWGGGGAIVWREAVGARADVGFKVGLAGRRYVETSTYTILSIPPGIDDARVRAAFVDERRARSRGGVWFGIDAPIRVARRLRVIPEVRYVHGPRQVGNAHREWSLGVRGAVGF